MRKAVRHSQGDGKQLGNKVGERTKSGEEEKGRHNWREGPGGEVGCVQRGCEELRRTSGGLTPLLLEHKWNR